MLYAVTRYLAVATVRLVNGLTYAIMVKVRLWMIISSNVHLINTKEWS